MKEGSTVSYETRQPQGRFVMEVSLGSDGDVDISTLLKELGRTEYKTVGSIKLSSEEARMLLLLLGEVNEG